MDALPALGVAGVSAPTDEQMAVHGISRARAVSQSWMPRPALIVTHHGCLHVLVSPCPLCLPFTFPNPGRRSSASDVTQQGGCRGENGAYWCPIF